jgi:FolB domain-containing protein
MGLAKHDDPSSRSRSRPDIGVRVGERPALSSTSPFMSRDRIEIEALQFDCIVGVHPDEREREQPVLADVRLDLDLMTAGKSGRIADTIDYDRVARELAALLKFRRYKLLENAAQECAAMLLGVHPALERIQLRLVKPQALARARTAGVTIERTPADSPRRAETKRFGDVEVLLETREAGLYLLHVAAGRTIPMHHHRVMRELEWLVAGELHSIVQGGGEHIVTSCLHGPPGLNAPTEWPYGQRHAYENRGSERATLFCCDTPPFIEDDEIVGDEAGA